MNQSPQRRNQIRFHCLDSLRAIAAFAVIYSHAAVFFEAPPFRLPLLLRALFDPKSAVVFFFVLSGFVLHLSIKNKHRTDLSYADFIIKRVFRIYPLFYLSISINYLIVINIPVDYVQTIQEGSGLHVMLGSSHDSFSNWFHQLTLIDHKFDSNFLNPPSWTLAAEMRVALMFPFISLILIKLRAAKGAVFVLAVFLACFFLGEVTIQTIQIIPVFALGAFLAETKIWEKVSFNPLRFSIYALVSISFYCWPAYRSFLGTPTTISFYLSSVGAIGIIILVLSSPRLRAILENRLLTALGRWSYGLYILHFGVFLVVSLMGKYWIPLNPSTSFVLAIFLLILLSATTFNFLELPFIHLGRHITKRPKKKPDHAHA
ncbi:MAG: acyltransferase [Verrucomicrobiales bacterium]|nr:acyltransferase [Verrucomicrobiales bacterium]